MGALAAGAIVLVPFPFSDLSRSKLRPAVVLAGAGRGDWVLCQITSNPYADSNAVVITEADVNNSGLLRTSYARPGKLFTANESLITSTIGELRRPCFRQMLLAVIRLLRSGAAV